MTYLYTYIFIGLLISYFWVPALGKSRLSVDTIASTLMWPALVLGAAAFGFHLLADAIRALGEARDKIAELAEEE